MEIPKPHNIATRMNIVILDQTSGDLPHREVLRDRSCREGTKSDVPVDLDVMYLSEEQKKRMQAVCQEFRDKFAFLTTEIGKAVGVK